jgi:beta-galactosidase
MIETPLRPRHDISDDWEFVRGRASRRWLRGRKRGGEIVDLPHCWNRTDTYQYGKPSYRGYGAYRRTLVLPEPVDRSGGWRLRSEGFFGLGGIWLDGRCLTRFDGQYLGFELDLPPTDGASEHILAIRLNNVWRRDVLPGRHDPDFLLYGGLAGRMWLEWVPADHIDTDSVEIVSTTEADGSESLEFRYAVNGRGPSRSAEAVHWVVSSPDGARIASTETGAVTIHDPRCWSPEAAHLYWAEGRLTVGGEVVDTVRVRFGITRAKFRPGEGFFLDGTRIDLHGCNRHESIPGLGNALPEELHRADAQLLKDYGCNFVRLSHYPQSPAFLDACDELGIMVYAEIASWKTVNSSRGWRRAARRQMRSMILRDRHHPSVIVWGMGNESRSKKAYLELKKIARELDPARPMTYAENHLYRAKRERTTGIPDVWSINYELDVFAEARESSFLENVIVSECCNFPLSTRGDDGAELTQVATLEYEWNLMAEKPYVAGHAVWAFTDYATEHRKRYRRQPGLFDAWRRPKMAAELFRARFADEAFVSLFLTGELGGRKLHAFTNCERLRFVRDGAPPIELEGKLHQVIDLQGKFTELIVEGERNQDTVVERLRAWRKAATVAITIDEVEAKPGRTVAVDFGVVDNEGTPVRNWNGHLQVTAEGDALLLPYTEGGEVLMARGEGRTYIRIGRSGGEIVIRVTGDELEERSSIVAPRR